MQYFIFFEKNWKKWAHSYPGIPSPSSAPFYPQYIADEFSISYNYRRQILKVIPPFNGKENV